MVARKANKNNAPREAPREAQWRSPWMTPMEASLYIGIALGTLRNWTSARFVPFAKRGRTVRYHRDRLDEWLASGACRGRSTFPVSLQSSERRDGKQDRE